MPRPGPSVDGKVVLITGAARGIGAESARHLARAGARVSLVGLEPLELEKVAAEIGANAIAIEADVTDQDALERAVAETLERFGGIDAVIANAGVAPAGTMRYIDPEAFDRTIEINVLGVARTIRACLPHVIDRQGYVLAVASLAAVAHAPGMAAYTASKAAVEAMANVLRLEVRHLGVDVGVAYFSWIATDMVSGGDEHPAFAGTRAELKGPLGTTYPVAAAGEAVLDGVARRRRWVTVPSWIRAALVLRGLLPLADRLSLSRAPEMDERFARDAAERGAEASGFVGAGGRAARSRNAERR